MPGFYLTLEGNCSACPSFCGSCINSTFCTSTSSSEGTFVTTINGTSVLIVCDQGCMTCQELNPVSCSACLPGYVLVAATNSIVSHCVPCSTNCRTCSSSSNSTACTSCFTGYFLLSNNTCVTCTGCLACPSSNLLSTCTACAANNLLRSNNSCDAISNAQEECGQLCSSCSQLPNGTFACDICSPGATLNSQGVCISCPNNCASCSLTRLGECTSCLPGTYFQLESENCVACNIANCLSCNEQGCLSCRSGYMVSPSFACMLKCVSPCSSCSETDPSLCTHCIAGFKTNNAASQNCEPDLDCNSNGTCTNCPFGYSLLVENFFSSCVACSSSCARCNPTQGNSGVCLSCYDGNWLNGNSCDSCPANCMKCINSESCLMCASGSVAMQAATQQTSDLNSGSGLASAGNEPVICLACSSPCVTCINSQTTCLTCETGFTLSGNNCLNSNAINVTVTFAPTGNVYSHFNDQFNTIITGMATAAGVAEKSVVIASVIYSSVVLSTVVASPTAAGTTESNTILTNLNTYFANLNLAELSVTQTSISDSSSTNGNGGSSSSSSDGDSNTTLIVAIVVPIIIVRTF